MKQGQFVSVDGIRTHYFEAGSGPALLLLHSAEYGGAAEFSWENNIEALAGHFHVLAPDHLGFGLTDKIFDFTNQFARRIRHIKCFLEVMGVDRAHVIGSSMSGGLSLAVAARPEPDWPIAKLVSCSGGGHSPPNPAREVLNSYDGTSAHMRRIIETMFVDPSFANDAGYIERRVEMSQLPGAWEATSAARLKAPFGGASRSERDSIDHGNIRVPTLIMAGRQDTLRKPGYGEDLVAEIPGAELHVFENAGHMGNIECAEEFNTRVIDFLKDD